MISQLNTFIFDLKFNTQMKFYKYFVYCRILSDICETDWFHKTSPSEKVEVFTSESEINWSTSKLNYGTNFLSPKNKDIDCLLDLKYQNERNLFRRLLISTGHSLFSNHLELRWMCRYLYRIIDSLLLIVIRVEH